MEKRVTLRSLTKRGRSCAYSEFFFGACVGAWSISLNFHLTACGVSSAQIGVLLCVGYLATAATSFFIGNVGDRKGYPFVMALGCALMCASLIMTVIFDRLPLFYISHLTYCIGLACVMSMEFNLPLSLVEENTRQYTYNLVLIMYFLGGIVGNTLCSAVYRIVKNEPYRVVLGLCAIIYAALAVFRGTMPRRQQRTEDVKRAWDIRDELRDKRVLGYLLYGVLAFDVFTLSTGMLNLVLREWRGMTDSAVSTVFAANSFIGCLTLLALPKITQWAKLSSIARLALTVQCVALLLITIAPTPLIVFLLFCRTVSCNMLYTAADAPMLRSIPQDKRGSYAGLRVFANHIGMSAASMLSGLFVDRGQFVLLYLTCGFLALAQGIVYCVFCRGNLKALDE